ncbi:MAG: cytochrome c [Opitutales bacterium]
MKTGLVHVLIGVLLVAWPVGCRKAMVDDGKLRPLSESEFFDDGAVARPLVPGTVSRGALNEDDHFYTGKVAGELVTTFPATVTSGMLERGRESYNIYCSVCHGLNGGGNGMIVQRGFPEPPSFHTDRLKEAPVGHYYDVITNGYGVMYSYASRVPSADRWNIAAYIRVLQLSRSVPFDALSTEEQEKLEAISP